MRWSLVVHSPSISKNLNYHACLCICLCDMRSSVCILLGFLRSRTKRWKQWRGEASNNETIINLQRKWSSKLCPHWLSVLYKKKSITDELLRGGHSKPLDKHYVLCSIDGWTKSTTIALNPTSVCHSSVLSEKPSYQMLHGPIGGHSMRENGSQNEARIPVKIPSRSHSAASKYPSSSSFLASFNRAFPIFDFWVFPRSN